MMGCSTITPLFSLSHTHSLLAVRSGASRVYACELNATMVAMSRDILSANGMMDSVTVIPKISTQAAVPTDLPERYSNQQKKFF